MVSKLRRGLNSVSAWMALFAVAGLAYAARRRNPADMVAARDEPVIAAAPEVSPIAE